MRNSLDDKETRFEDAWRNGPGADLVNVVLRATEALQRLRRLMAGADQPRQAAEGDEAEAEDRPPPRQASG